MKLQGTPSDGILSDIRGQREGQTRLVVASRSCFAKAATRDKITTIRKF
jgi:hypothetical protein